MKRLIVDLDHTVCTPDADADQTQDIFAHYREAQPVWPVIEQLRAYRAKGFEIVIHTARNMRTFNGDITQLEAVTYPIIIEWLEKYDVPFDTVIVGKPWCGFDGLYIDDRAVRPSEFVGQSYDEIVEMLEREKSCLPKIS